MTAKQPRQSKVARYLIVPSEARRGRSGLRFCFRLTVTESLDKELGALLPVPLGEGPLWLQCTEDPAVTVGLFREDGSPGRIHFTVDFSRDRQAVGRLGEEYEVVQATMLERIGKLLRAQVSQGVELHRWIETAVVPATPLSTRPGALPPQLGSGSDPSERVWLMAVDLAIGEKPESASRRVFLGWNDGELVRSQGLEALPVKSFDEAFAKRDVLPLERLGALLRGHEP